MLTFHRIPSVLVPYYLLLRLPTTLTIQEAAKQGTDDTVAKDVLMAGLNEVDGTKRLVFEDLCKLPALTPPTKWKALAATANALNSVQAPWNIHGGTLLGLVRSCSVFDSDLDFVVDREWLQDSENRTRLGGALAEANLSRAWQLGVLTENGGYEEQLVSSEETSLLRMERSRRHDRAGNRTGSVAYKALLQNIALLPSAQVRARYRFLHQLGVSVDLFTVERFEDHYEWNLWVNGTQHTCSSNATGTESYSWLGVDVKVPVPVEDVLTSAYGPDYMTPAPWQWDVGPFINGSCK